mmetsp:Transcript_2898/g.4211  ORF Transcript_2898/g.4211 Transcript_2898/m.4211 type:complete len:102 (-) Transcript_2898:71-376(-)
MIVVKKQHKWETSKEIIIRLGVVYVKLDFSLQDCSSRLVELRLWSGWDLGSAITRSSVCVTHILLGFCTSTLSDSDYSSSVNDKLGSNYKLSYSHKLLLLL